MIDKEDFKGMCDRLARATGKIDQETREVYYEAFKTHDREALAKAMKRVGREHSFYKFPTIAEIADAVRDSHEEKRPTPTYCTMCNMTGMVIVEKDGRTSAFRCSCENGKRVSSRIRPFSDVSHLYDAPKDDSPIHVIPVDGLEALPYDMVFEAGAAVEKTCSSCWKKYRYEHRRRVDVKTLKEMHLSRPALCEACFVEEGAQKGLWKKPQEQA